MRILSAPIQEYTTVEWRNAHRRVVGGIEEYYAPFARLEKGELSSRAEKDLSPEANDLGDVVPQILAKSADEARVLIQKISTLGYSRIDFNSCCPFEKVVRHGYGAGVITSPQAVSEMFGVLEEFPGIRFSVKLRLGNCSAQEAFALLPILNAVRLEKIVLHPRTAIQQYDGIPDRDAFLHFADHCIHDVFYNGDILTYDDAIKYDNIMVGRGLLANPLLPLKIKGLSIPPNALLRFHEEYVTECQQRCQQALPKLKLLWNYFLPGSDRRLRKAIQKARSLEECLGFSRQAIESVCLEG